MRLVKKRLTPLRIVIDMLIIRTPILRVLTRTSSSGAARMLRARLFA